MSTGLLFLSIVLGLYLTGAYLERKRRVPGLNEVLADMTAFNRGLEMELAQRAPKSRMMSKTLRKAGLGGGAKLSYLVLAMCAAAVIGWQAGTNLLPGFVSRVAVALAFGAVPLGIVVQRASARDAAISAQLPLILTNIIPALLSGTRQVENCFREFVRERRELGPSGKQQRFIGPSMANPLGPELFRVYHDVAFGGLSLDVAIGKSIRHIEHQGYEDVLIGILAAARSATPAKELADLRMAVERERASQREVASAISMIMMEAAAVPAIGLIGLVIMRFVMPGATAYLSQPGAQIMVVFAWLLGAANILRGKRIASLPHILRRIEI